jgi:hypothetical protein
MRIEGRWGEKGTALKDYLIRIHRREKNNLRIPKKPPRPRQGERIEVRGKPPRAHPHPYPLPPAGERDALFFNESLNHRKQGEL